MRCQRGTGGVVFHVINRGVRRLTLFQHDGDYRAWLRAFADAQGRVPIDLFAYCLMPNHFHLVLRPREDGDLAEFMRLGSVTHSKRWHAARGSNGTGAVYQGRYRAFAIGSDRYFLNACRYVEANPLRAALVPRAEDWTWSSLSIRRKNFNALALTEWPILQPGGWVNLVNQSHSEGELNALRRCVRRSAPFGPDEWAKATAAALGLERAFRATGRPKKTTSGVVS